MPPGCAPPSPPSRCTPRRRRWLAAATPVCRGGRSARTGTTSARCCPPPTASSRSTAFTTSSSRTGWCAAPAGSSTSTTRPPSSVSCPPGAGSGRACCCSCAASVSGAGQGLLDGDRALHSGVDGADVLEPAGGAEGVLERIAAAHAAGGAGLEVLAWAAGLGDVVRDRVVVRPGDGGTLGHCHISGLEADVLHRHGGGLWGGSAPAVGRLLLGRLSACALIASLVVAAA